MAREVKELPPLTDEDLMPSGKYKGIKMEDIPAEYLRYIYDNQMCTQRVQHYIVVNLEVIDQQIKQNKK